MTITLDGLDMKDTITWYKNNDIRPPLRSDSQLLNGPADIPIYNPEKIALSAPEIRHLISLFPVSTLERAIVHSISGEDPLWFSRETMPSFCGIRTTTMRDEALCPTAVIPSYADYSPWKQTGTPGMDIKIYAISDDIAPLEVRRIIAAQGLVHEFGHGVVAPLTYCSDYKLRFPVGNIMDGKQVLMQFEEITRSLPPISHYASFYRAADGSFDTSDGFGGFVSVGEEFCESIAAYILGFSFRKNLSSKFDAFHPFHDRPKVAAFIENFLDAELLK